MKKEYKFKVELCTKSGELCTLCKNLLQKGQKFIEIKEDLRAREKIIRKAGKYHFQCIAKRNYFIAFLDILGFTQFTQNSTLDEVYNEIQNMFAAARASRVEGNVRIGNSNNPITLSNLMYLTISDSIIVFQEVIQLVDIEEEFKWKEESFGEFILGLEELYKEAFKRKIFLRGGISYGEAIISLDSENKENIILGNTYIEAVKMEKVQSWMGFAFHPSMGEYLNKTSYKSILVEYDIPVKKEYVNLGIPNFTIGWVDSSNAQDRDIFKGWVTENDRQNEIKINTLKFFEDCIKRESRALNIGVDLEQV